MSRIGRLGLIAAVGLLAWPGSTTAQETEAQETLRQRLDSLRPLLESATAEMEVFERERERAKREAAAAAGNLDTLRIGLMTVVTPTDQAETARELFTEVWEEHFADIGRSPGVEEAIFSFRYSNERVPIHLSEQRQQRIELQRYLPRDRVAEQVRRAIGTSITFDLAARGTRVGKWLRDDPHRDHDIEAIYRQLATVGSKSARSCLDGNVDACEVSLGFGLEEVGRLTRWYEPEERRALVAGRPTMGTGRRTAEAWEACVHGADIDSCDALLDDPRGDWAPLQGPARASLLSLALDRGGAGAWERLVEDPSMPAEEAIQYASGLDIEALVAEWRSWVVEGRPDVYRGLLPRGGLALLWTLLFAAFAMRSTRWRLG